MFMATKTLTIMEDAYELLKRQKRKDESFSEVIRRELGKKRNIMEFAGAWSHLSEKQFKEMENVIKKGRENTQKSVAKKLGLKVK